MSTLRQTAVAIEELLEGWNLATRFLQNMVPQDPSHTIDELLVAANDVFLKVFSIFADEGTFLTFNPCLALLNITQLPDATCISRVLKTVSSLT